MVGGEERRQVQDLQGLHERLDGLLRRGLAQEGAAAVHPDRRAARAHERQELRGVFHQGGEHVGGVADHVEEPALDGPRAGEFGQAGGFLLGGDFRGSGLAEEFAGRARRRGREVRLAVMARHEPPQFAVDEQRHRHGSSDAHVAQVFEVDRRHAAQRGEAQIQRAAGLRVERRLQRGRLVGHGRDEAQPVLLVQRAGLRRDVGGRVMQAQIRIHARGGQRLADDRAVPVGVEAVDHHALEARQVGNRLRDDRVERGQSGGGAHGREGALQAAMPLRKTRRGGVAAGRLQFDNQHAVAAVQEGIERAAIDLHRQRGDLPRIGAGERGGDACRERLPEARAERAAEQFPGRAAEQGRGVGAGLRADEVRLVDGEQQAVRLDRAGEVDGFAGADVEVQRLGVSRSTHGPDIVSHTSGAGR